MCRLNQCRLYLQVTLLSEITSANGRNILPSYIQGNKHTNRRALLTWPRQDRPPLKAWHEWTKRLTQAYCTSQKGSWLRIPLVLQSDAKLGFFFPCSSSSSSGCALNRTLIRGLLQHYGEPGVHRTPSICLSSKSKTRYVVSRSIFCCICCCRVFKKRRGAEAIRML
jgi:hypothetical protein